MVDWATVFLLTKDLIELEIKIIFPLKFLHCYRSGQVTVLAFQDIGIPLLVTTADKEAFGIKKFLDAAGKVAEHIFRNYYQTALINKYVAGLLVPPALVKQMHTYFDTVQIQQLKPQKQHKQQGINIRRNETTKNTSHARNMRAMIGFFVSTAACGMPLARATTRLQVKQSLMPGMATNRRLV